MVVVESIEVDVSALKVGDMLYIRDVAWTEGVTPTLNGDVVVALVAKTRVAMSEAASAGSADAGEEAAGGDEG